MKKTTFTLMIFFLTMCCIAQKTEKNNISYFNTLPHLSIRALEVLNDSTIWFAANHGVWGFTNDDGKTFHIDSIKVDSLYPEFRSIATLNDSTVLLLSVASPAYLFKTTNKGKSWRMVYKNNHKDIFFDSMKFSDTKNGIAIGDPIDSCFQILKTNYGGETWKKINCGVIPKAKEDEACFAASNSCISIVKNKIWFATGGKHARIFYSPDFGEHFTAYSTPVVQGETMTGSYSVDFSDANNGIVAGGNYDKTDSTITSMAITYDGGKTWSAAKTETPFFGSCVQFNRKKKNIFVTGHNGTFESNDSGKTFSEIKDADGNALKFHTFRFSPSGNVIWFAGNKGRIACRKK